MAIRRICEVGAFGASISLAVATHCAQGLAPTASIATPSEATASQMSADPAASLLDTGFRYLYELNFQEARETIATYQKRRPEDPLGIAAEAASYLFEQFNDKGVLTSEFFLNDSRFLGGIEGTPSENTNAAFLGANRRARELAKMSLKLDARNVNGLLVLTLADGMESDYDAIIERKYIAAIRLMRQAEHEAEATLAADPSAQDVYVALGMSNYVIASLPVFKRAFLWMGGVHGDRARGMNQLHEAADHGRYLRPLAKVILALAYEREHQPDHARQLFAELVAEFPNNPLFSHELALLDQRTLRRRGELLPVG
jgi:hypothetical protein